jgi:hypothetical protein
MAFHHALRNWNVVVSWGLCGFLLTHGCASSWTKARSWLRGSARALPPLAPQTIKATKLLHSYLTLKHSYLYVADCLDGHGREKKPELTPPLPCNLRFGPVRVSLGALLSSKRHNPRHLFIATTIEACQHRLAHLPPTRPRRHYSILPLRSVTHPGTSRR